MTGYPSTCSIPRDDCGSRTICNGPVTSSVGWRSNAVVSDGETIIVVDESCVFEPVDDLSNRLVGRVEVLSDTSNRVTTLEGEEDLRSRVIEYLIHPVVTNNME